MQWFGIVLMVAAALAAYGTWTTWDQAHDYRLGDMGPGLRITLNILGIILSTFLSLGGVYCLFNNRREK